MSETLHAVSSVAPFFRSELSPERLLDLQSRSVSAYSTYNLAPFAWQNDYESPLNKANPDTPSRCPLSGIVHIADMVMQTRPRFEGQLHSLLLDNDTLFAIGSLSLRGDALRAETEELVAAVNEVLEAVGSPYKL